MMKADIKAYLAFELAEDGKLKYEMEGSAFDLLVGITAGLEQITAAGDDVRFEEIIKNIERIHMMRKGKHED